MRKVNFSPLKIINMGFFITTKRVARVVIFTFFLLHRDAHVFWHATKILRKLMFLGKTDPSSLKHPK